MFPTVSFEFQNDVKQYFDNYYTVKVKKKISNLIIFNLIKIIIKYIFCDCGNNVEKYYDLMYKENLENVRDKIVYNS